MSADELAGLKRRFRRGRTEAHGSGLGLAIAERIVTQIGGRLELLSPATGRSEGFEARIVGGNLPTWSRPAQQIIKGQ